MSKHTRFDPAHGLGDPHLPLQPEEVHRLQAGLSREGVELRDVAALIAGSPSLTREFLRHVNGVRFGLSRPVTSVPHAVALLGLRQLELFAVRTLDQLATAAESARR